MHKALAVAVLISSSALPPAFAAKAESPEAATHAPIVQDSASDEVLRVQVLLERAHFSPGEIDGVFGSNVAKAVAGFQRSRGLPDSGALDESTWAQLETDAVPTLVEYTVTAEDVAGPYIEIPDDTMEKAKLPALGYRNLAEALGERFHASPALLQSLNAGKTLDVAGQIIQVPNIDGLSKLPKASSLIVDQSDLTVSLLDAEQKVIAQFPATTGSSHDPLPIGDWKIQGVARNATYSYNPELFWNGNPEHEKALLPAGPNNPVGGIWIDLSKPHYGIHGTPEPAMIGKIESNGCIRLTNWNAALLADAVYPGMPATLRD